MRFIINKEISYTHKDRVLILEREEDYFKHDRLTNVKYLCNAVIKVTEDWDINEEFPIVDDIASIQFRPKGIFKNKKGYFYKNKETVYLTDKEVLEMELFINSAKKYLENGKTNLQTIWA